MKRNYRKILICLLLCGSMLLSLSSCSMNDTSIDELMKPPQLSASRQQVQNAIRSLLGTSYSLIAPNGGDYRSNINLCDLNGDEQNEAICFFTTGDTQLIEMLALKKESDAWVEIGRHKSDATDVNKIDFIDMNHDGTKEILVGWSYMTGSEHTLEVLQIEDNLFSRYKERYSQFLVTEGEKRQAVVIDLGTASATLLGMKNKRVYSLSSVPIDSRIASFTALTVSFTTKGDPAIYMDTQLQDQTYHTEILVINSGEYLENKLLTGETSGVDRLYNLRCTDIDGDSLPEVPRTAPMGGGDTISYYTYWSRFDGVELEEPLTTFTSVGEQFYFEYPKAWRGSVFVRQDSKMQRLYHFVNYKDEILYSLRVFTVAEYEQVNAAAGWIELIETTDKVIAYKIGTVKNTRLALTTEDWAAALHTY